MPTHYDVVITNPPYTIGNPNRKGVGYKVYHHHVMKSAAIADHVIALTPANWCGYVQPKFTPFRELMSQHMTRINFYTDKDLGVQH